MNKTWCQEWDSNDPHQDVIIECDSSDVGLGAVLMQEGWPVAYASRALTKTERNYAQIEKECLAIVFATQRFEQYILGKDKVTIFTDHKPLVTIFGKPILASPKRLQRMRLTLQKYSLNLHHKPGVKMYISDTLSRASLPIEQDNDQIPDYLICQLDSEKAITDDIENTVNDEVIFVTDERLEKIRREISMDVTLQTLMSVIYKGWAENKNNVPLAIREYWPYRDELAAANGLVFRGTRIIIPLTMRPEMTTRAHASHLGIHYTLNTAR